MGPARRIYVIYNILYVTTYNQTVVTHWKNERNG